MAENILVVGAGGRLGQALMRELSGDFSLHGLDRQSLDLRHTGDIRRVLGDLEYSLVLVPAALTAVDYCEDNEAEAYAINGDAPGEIARISKSRGAKVVYFGTDFVFDGEKKDPYVESDEVHPISVYGASKLEGERQVLSASGDNLVLRLAWVFGPERPGFPEWIVSQALEKEHLSLPGDKIGSPTYARDVAQWMRAFLPGGRAAGAGGVVHLGNSGSCSWAEWGGACLRAAGERGAPVKTLDVAPGALAEVAAFRAARPRNSALDTARFQELTGIKPRPWQEAVGAHFEAAAREQRP